MPKTLIKMCLGLALVAFSPAAALEQASNGQGDQRVNSTVSSTQELPAVALHAGGWVAAWQSREGEADLEIRARVRTLAGTTDEILVNDSSLGTQMHPAVATDRDGNFIVVWTSNEPVGVDGDESGFGIAARFYLADGTPRGPAFQVNSLTAGHQLQPSVDMDADGRLVITWRSNTSAGSDLNTSSVQARVFSAVGQPLGGDFQVNTYTPYSQQYPDVAFAPDGTFTIVWQSLLQDGSIDGIYARRFAADGSALSGERQVNVETLGAQSFPAVATAGNGRTLIVWESEDADHNLEIRGRLFAASGQAISPELQMNTMRGGAQSLPDVTAVQNGFVVAWQSEETAGDDVDGYSIQMRAFDLAGQASAPEMQLNLSTSSSQEHVAVAGFGESLVFLWDSDHVGSTSEDVYALDATAMAGSKPGTGQQRR